MPTFEATTTLACPPERVWEFLTCPGNLLEVSPPDLHLRLVEGPAVLSLGARISVQGRKWGVSQRITNEVTRFEPPLLLVDEQREGPFGKFVHTHRLEAVPNGTCMTDTIEYEAPAGLLGLVLTAGLIRADLEKMFAHREKRFREIFGVGGG
jgi:ligand-binding SRPBCC domain-containing protein